MPLQFPEWDKTFKMNTLRCTDDYLLRLSRDICERFDQVRHAVSSEIATELMNDEIDYDMEHSGFYEHLRQLAGLEGETTRHMHPLCDYIYWAHVSNIELAFDLTEEEYNRCQITKEKGVYSEFLAHEELTALPVNELMHVLLDFADILAGDLDWRQSETFADYFHGDVFPKMVLFSTH